MKKPVYIRCPRCSVCKAELSAKKDELIGDLDLELCPICKTNYIQPDEIMCSTCLKEHQSEDEDGADWEDYLNRDEEEIVYDDEETGDMASVTDIDDDIDDDIDTDIGFDDRIDDSSIDDELGDEFDEEFDEDDDFDEENDNEDEDDDDDLDDDDDEEDDEDDDF